MLKRVIFRYLKSKYPMAIRIYNRYKFNNLDFHEKNKCKSWIYLIKLILCDQDENKLSAIKKPYGDEAKPKVEESFTLESTVNHRPGIKQSIAKDLAKCDILSLDIFDTAILRNVENARDTFLIMAAEMGFPNFKAIRNQAEQMAREKKYSTENTREITLEDIYSVLENYFGIEKHWMKREMEIEYDICVQNPYIYSVYKEALELNKRVIFVSDMYLNKEFIRSLLRKCGYLEYDNLFLSNDLKASKEDLLIWSYITKEYAKDKKIFHIGDNYRTDIKNAKQFGIATYFYRSLRELAKPFREDFINNLGGSFYRAIINNNLHNGIWKHTPLYEHGFKVAGIMHYGYCEFIDKVAKEQNCDLILFCARDCDTINKIYKLYFNNIESAYVFVSRFALINISLERFYEDLISRIFNNDLNNKVRKSIRDLLKIANLEYLIKSFNEEVFNVDTQLSFSNIERVKNFLYKHQNEVIQKHNGEKMAAIKYFSEIIKNHKKILIADVGWSGSSYSVLKYFIQKNINENVSIIGTLLIGNNNENVSIMSMDNTMYCYLISPVKNCDLLRYQFKKDKNQTHINCQIVEYMFSSVSESLLRYDLDGKGKVRFIYKTRSHQCDSDIIEIQRGILDFANQFYIATRSYRSSFCISPYVACGAFYKTLDNKEYNKLIYRNFIYDAQMGILGDKDEKSFIEYLEPNESSIIKKNDGKNILLVSHSFSVSGAPRSLLRIGKVLIANGFNAEVWCPYDGGIKVEYEKNGITTKIIKSDTLFSKNIVNEIKTFDMAICNTILTYNFYEVLRKYIPTVWYIREATNIPDYCTETFNTLMYSELIHADNIVCVSDYAKVALNKYNKNVKVLQNCVEDLSEFALPYIPAKDGVVRFIQLGSLEKRKGYHLLLDAIEQLSESYQKKSRFYFAGQIVKTAQEYADNIICRIDKISNTEYLGVVSDEKQKVEFMSQMDVVIVASLDESCSLVALEGTMLSKPLIVTENVGAKYMVDEGKNGKIVKANDVNSLKNAIIYFIDNKDKLNDMGDHSRLNYNTRSNMKVYAQNILSLVQNNIGKKPSKKSIINKSRIKSAYRKADLAEKERILNFTEIRYASLYEVLKRNFESTKRSIVEEHQKSLPRNKEIIVSLTSYPARIKGIDICIKSILNQYFKADKVILWLAKEQFPHLEEDLPSELLALKRRGLTINWCDDLKPHKKYYYAMLENKEAIVVTVDDDMDYPSDLLGKLYESYLRHPHAISCLRAHLIKFNYNGTIKKYKDWGFEDNSYIDTPTYRLLPTGVMGVLYPPHSLPPEAFNKEAIEKNCLMTDDVWLKCMCVANGYPSVLAEKQFPIKCVEGTQQTAISLFNIEVGNDINIKQTLNYCNTIFPNNLVLERLKGNDDKDIH